MSHFEGDKIMKVITKGGYPIHVIKKKEATQHG